jgi:Flp pilus assembly protein TadG
MVYPDKHSLVPIADERREQHMIAHTTPGRRHPRGRHGVAAVEFAFALPLLLVILAGIWEVGAIVEVQQILSNAARVGGRQASTGLNTSPQVQQAVTQYLQAAGLRTGNVNVTVTNVTSGGDVSNANQMDQLTVTATIPFKDVAWDLLYYVVPAGSQLSGTATWYCMKDLPVTVSTTLPVQ